MAEWPLQGATPIAGDFGANFVSGFSADTESAWTTLSSGLAVPACGIELSLMPVTSGRDHLCDLALGAVGSEQAICTDLIAGKGSANHQHIYRLPLTIPAGVRISGRHMSHAFGNVGLTFSAFAFLSGGNTLSYGRCESLGVNPADSGGTSVDPGGSAGTYGAWTQLAASTSFHARALILTAGNQTNTVRTSMFGDVQVGIGSAGSEQAILDRIALEADATMDGPCRPVMGPFPVNIPKGSRIAVRMRMSITDATDRLFDFAVYLFG